MPCCHELFLIPHLGAKWNLQVHSAGLGHVTYFSTVSTLADMIQTFDWYLLN